MTIKTKIQIVVLIALLLQAITIAMTLEAMGVK